MPNTIVSVEKMLTNILRKLDILDARNVVTAQTRTAPPSSAAAMFICMTGCTSAARPNSATATLNGFMGFFQVSSPWR